MVTSGAAGAISVRGGSGSICAELDRFTRYASNLDGASASVGQAIQSAARLLYDEAMLRAGLLDPPGAIRVAAGATATSALGAGVLVSCTALAASLRAAALSYRAADVLDDRVRPVVQAGWRLPGAVLSVARDGAGRSPITDLQALLTHDPELADVAIDLVAAAGSAALSLTGMGPVTREGPLTATTQLLAGLLASPYRDGAPVVTARAELATIDERGAPRGVADLLTGLAVRDGADDGGGAIDIRILTGFQPAGAAAGSAPSGLPCSAPGRRVIVDITGTTIWNFDPHRHTPQASDMSTNLRALANRSSVMERGIIEALHRAGVAPQEPIMLVGHSQGGLVAARLAADLNATGEFSVAQLLTAGSPLGLSAIPASVAVLAVQNKGDLVPHLAGVDNPRRPNWLTVQGDHGGDSLLAKHAISSYLAVATDLDRSQDESLRSWRQQAGQFFDASQVHSQVFQVRRAE